MWTAEVVGRSSVAPTVIAAGAPPGPASGRTAAGRAVVPGRRHDERVERERAVDGASRAVGEGGEWLGQPDERDPRRVVRVAVAVGIDRRSSPAISWSVRA